MNTQNRHYRTRTLEHNSASPLTWKCVKNNSQTSAVQDQTLFCKTVVCPEVYSILAKSYEISNLRFRKVFWLNYKS